MKAICPHCGQKYTHLPDEYLNKRLECASCHKNFTCTEAKTCQKCGELSPADALKCSHCGEFFLVRPKVSVPPQKEAPAAVAAPVAAPPNGGGDKAKGGPSGKPKKESTGKNPVLGDRLMSFLYSPRICAFCLFAGFVIFFLFMIFNIWSSVSYDLSRIGKIQKLQERKQQALDEKLKSSSGILTNVKSCRDSFDHMVLELSESAGGSGRGTSRGRSRGTGSGSDEGFRGFRISQSADNYDIPGSFSTTEDVRETAALVRRMKEDVSRVKSDVRNQIDKMTASFVHAREAIDSRLTQSAGTQPARRRIHVDMKSGRKFYQPGAEPPLRKLDWRQIRRGAESMDFSFASPGRRTMTGRSSLRKSVVDFCDVMCFVQDNLLSREELTIESPGERASEREVSPGQAKQDAELLKSRKELDGYIRDFENYRDMVCGGWQIDKELEDVSGQITSLVAELDTMQAAIDEDDEAIRGVRREIWSYLVREICILLGIASAIFIVVCLIVAFFSIEFEIRKRGLPEK